MLTNSIITITTTNDIGLTTTTNMRSLIVVSVIGMNEARPEMTMF